MNIIAELNTTAEKYKGLNDAVCELKNLTSKIDYASDKIDDDGDMIIRGMEYKNKDEIRLWLGLFSADVRRIESLTSLINFKLKGLIDEMNKALESSQLFDDELAELNQKKEKEATSEDELIHIEVDTETPKTKKTKK